MFTKPLKEHDWRELAEKFSFVREIFEQPEALGQLVTYYTGATGLGALERARQVMNGSSPPAFIISGMGSSLFSGYLLHLRLLQLGIKSTFIDAGEFLYSVLEARGKGLDAPINKNGDTVLVLVSQSGESAETVKVLARAGAKATTWAITNCEDSTLAKGASITFPIVAGKETSVTSKTFVNSLTLMHVLGSVLASSPAVPVKEVVHGLVPSLEGLKEAIEKLLKDHQDLGDKMVQFFGEDCGHVELVARGPSLATAWQASLNIKETNKIAAEALSVGQFRHGPIEMVDRHFKAFLFSSSSPTRALDEGLAWNVAHKWGGGKLVYLTNQHSEKLDGEARVLQIVHQVPDELAPAIEIVLVQLFMVRHAVANDILPGVFKYSSKVTTDG